MIVKKKYKIEIKRKIIKLKKTKLKKEEKRFMIRMNSEAT
jgi:hypothetical protein